MIDFHLKPENASMSKEEKMEEISAQLYAYYRHTGELTEQQIGAVKTEIANRTHLLIWKNIDRQSVLEKELVTLKKDEIELEKATLALMN